MRVGEIELVARARDRDVKQTPLFLQRVARIERAAAGEHAVGQPDHEDSMKLQTFCLMHAGEIDGFFLVCLNGSSFRVDVADQCQLREKLVYVSELASERCELVKIFPAKLVIREIHLCVIVVNRFHD